MLPRPHRLRHTRDLARVRKFGRSARGQLFVVRCFRRDTDGPTRFAVIVSKKVAKNATDRNRLTRRVRAHLSFLLPTLRSTHDVLVIAQRKFEDYDRQIYEDDLAALFLRLRLFQRP